MVEKAVPGRRILIVEDDNAISNLLGDALKVEGYQSVITPTAEKATHTLSKPPLPHLVLVDIGLPGKDGLALLSEIKVAYPKLPVIMVTAFDRPGTWIEAMQRGADDFVPKPFDLDDLVHKINDVLSKAEQHSPSKEIAELQQSLKENNESPLNKLVGTRSTPMQNLLKDIGIAAYERASNLAVPVLIRGGIGTFTEAEAVAQLIHEASPRGVRGSFVTLDPTIIPRQLEAKELRGTKEGAYQGAQDEPGIIERANNGTLFVPDLADLHGYQAAQSLLVDVVHKRQIARLGTTEPTSVDIRIVAFSSVDPGELHRESMLSPSLVFQWGYKIKLPSLDERKADIPELLAATLNKLHIDNGVDEKAVTYLMERRWPGNLQEFENTIMEASLKAKGEVIATEHLQPLMNTYEASAQEEAH